MFTLWHFVVIGIFAICMIIAVHYTKHMEQKSVEKLILIVAIVASVMEIVKIIIKIYKHSSLNGWVPLYFCSLFLYASWFAVCKNQFIKNMGYSFLVCGGIVASLCYVIFPTTSLLLYPVWHPATIHGFVYHWLMMYVGIMVAVSGLYRPKAKDFGSYFLFTTFFTVLAVVLNHFTGANLMLISKPFGIPLFYDLYNISPVLFSFIIFLAQSVALFWAVYGFFRLKQSKLQRKQTKAEMLEDDELKINEL